jgi:hypothetical protein
MPGGINYYSPAVTDPRTGLIIGGGGGATATNGAPAGTGSGTANSPAPHAGQGAYGLVPGDISNPNPFGDLSALYPNLSGANSQVSQNIQNELMGNLSPSTINNIRNNAASFGVSTGMPGSQFQGDQGLANLGLTTEKLQGQGLQDYLAAITGINKTQTVDPALQTQIATQNSVWNAAPDPAAAAKEQQKLFDEYLAKTMSPAGGTGAGANTGVPWYAQGNNATAFNQNKGQSFVMANR